MMAIFLAMVEKSNEIFMDDYLVIGASFDDCLCNLESVFKRYKKTNLVLNWEKCHFMVKEDIVLGHRVFENGIEVDKAKIETNEKLPPLTSVKGIRSFLGHVGIYRRFIEDFSTIEKPLSSLLMWCKSTRNRILRAHNQRHKHPRKAIIGLVDPLEPLNTNKQEP